MAQRITTVKWQDWRGKHYDTEKEADEANLCYKFQSLFDMDAWDGMTVEQASNVVCTNIKVLYPTLKALYESVSEGE